MSGMKLSDYLKKEGLSDAEFARQLGVGRSSIGRYAAGKRKPRWEVLARIAKVTRGKVTALDFMDDRSRAA
jgi:transcriptional regulator with XRE-family HTH domain